MTEVAVQIDAIAQDRSIELAHIPRPTRPDQLSGSRGIGFALVASFGIYGAIAAAVYHLFF